jgi:mycofactocin precursor
MDNRPHTQQSAPDPTDIIDVADLVEEVSIDGMCGVY